MSGLPRGGVNWSQMAFFQLHPDIFQPRHQVSRMRRPAVLNGSLHFHRPTIFRCPYSMGIVSGVDSILTARHAPVLITPICRGLCAVSNRRDMRTVGSGGALMTHADHFQLGSTSEQDAITKAQYGFFSCDVGSAAR